MRPSALWFLPVIAILLSPSFYVHALPPPDLIVSISQSILSSLGAIAAALVIAASTIATFFRQWVTTLAGKRVLVGISSLAVVAVAVAGGAFYNEWKLNAWKEQVNIDMRELWSSYESVYSAEVEEEARYDMESAAAWVTWPQFQNTVGEREYVIIDIRDRYPYEIGHIPDSEHLRLAELFRGEWEQIEQYKDKPVLIVCYLGTTGAMASQFLEAQGFSELYQLEDGITASVYRDESLPFTGSAVLPRDERYRDRLSVEEVQRKLEAGAEVIDLRFPNDYEESMPFSVHHQFFRERATQEEIDTFVSDLSSNTPHIMLCKGSASCYSARMLLLDLDRFDKDGVGMINILEPNGEYI